MNLAPLHSKSTSRHWRETNLFVILALLPNLFNKQEITWTLLSLCLQVRYKFAIFTPRMILISQRLWDKPTLRQQHTEKKVTRNYLHEIQNISPTQLTYCAFCFKHTYMFSPFTYYSLFTITWHMTSVVVESTQSEYKTILSTSPRPSPLPVESKSKFKSLTSESWVLM